MELKYFCFLDMVLQFFSFLKLLNCKIICNPDGIEWRRPNNFLKKIILKFARLYLQKLKFQKFMTLRLLEDIICLNIDLMEKQFIILQNLRKC